ncbi:AfsR/SARP family transcriptional regulator [Candidatus Formimonas warabiya]|uniref:OmpR/PhoB-type domain-containing protein n=1 Tax=Formimonas warabiya TaxID=1761012 RepID=A0A3G1KMD7_FORW1|nr:winged helix-turn-helix domain-containing protein [Candidatus Formimonas warabiya]ATW23612.1 hypothetical protein DCMF_01290 [Candidatus Formimonas warabiya]
MRDRYGIILQYALANDIEPDFARQMMDLAGFGEKKIYIETFGGFSVFACKNRKRPVKMRSKKERELLAFLIDAGDDGATKEQIYEAIWFDSESRNIKKLIDVNITHIRTDLAGLGISLSVVNHQKHYILCRDEITSDIDLFEAACSAFEQQPCIDTAQKILSLYKGEYLSGFEALWAVPKRIKYRRIYEEAVKYCKT